MTLANIEEENSSHANYSLGSDQTHEVIEESFVPFKRLVRSHIGFHLFFLVLSITEISLWIYFFTFLAQSFILSGSLALIFLTFFSYFILRLYFKAKKPEQLDWLVSDYVENCKKLMDYRDENPEDYLLLANACCKFADFVDGKELHVYSLPRWAKGLSTYIERFSYWCHWSDFHRIKELLLLKAIEENIKLVKCEPTSLEVHASLANAYVMLSGLYIDPCHIDGSDEERWIPSFDSTEGMDVKFRLASERAIEEFKILRDYAPNDPWVHAQLAYSYHDLKMPQEEIKEYETLLALAPGDHEIVFKLGMLYFQQGLNAQGLRMYDQIKRTNIKKAEDLIKFYGAYAPFERK